MTAKVKGLTSGAMMGMVVVITGCDRVSLGGVWRQVTGKQNGLKAEVVVPVAELRAKRKLTPKLDGYISGQFAIGKASAQDYLIKVETEGDFESLELGFDYFPLKTRELGLGVGVGIFRAKYEVVGRWEKIGLKQSDQFYGLTFNPALIGEISPISNENYKLVWRVGRHFTQTHIERGEIEVDLGGWYAGIGVEISLNR